MDRESITGLVLAGGAGRRMGGRDKGLLPFRGKTLAAHQLDWLRPQVGPLLVSANRNLDDYAALGVPVFGDPRGFAGEGPLAGMLAGFDHCRTPWMMVVPCDTPQLPAALVQRLADACAASGARIAVPRAAGRMQPAVALLDAALRDDLAAALASGCRRLADWMEPHAPALVDVDDADTFANLNTPDDLARLAAHS